MSELGGDAAAAAAAGEGCAQHARSFKLRFAAQREPGRSDVSLVKPLGLPATVTDKFYSRAPAPDGSPERRALRRIRELFDRGPRERLPAPLTESHEYGWWCGTGAGAGAGAGAGEHGDRRLNHHIRDSAWLKARLLVLAADEKLKRK